MTVLDDRATAALAPGSGEVILQLDRVSKTYASGALEVHALRDVSLTVRRGEYVSIVGPSGSGKSTMMNILGCLDIATEGSYMLGGVDVEEMDEAQLAQVRNRQIGFVFQQFNLLPSLTALRNVELPLCYAGVRKDVRRQRAREALGRVGLADRVDHRPNELSGGQQQRVAVARALVGDPTLILADEPTGNLDSHSTADVLALLAELHATGRTIVLITHEPAVAATAERTIHVRDGQIFADESSRPTDRGLPVRGLPVRGLPVQGSSALGPSELGPWAGPSELGPSSWPLGAGPLGAGPVGAGRGPTVRWTETWRIALEAVRTHRLRSMLTVLGIFIGIASVTLTVGLGQGAQQEVEDQINSLGSNLLIVSPGSSTTSGVRGGRGTATTLTMADAQALANPAVAPDIGKVAPVSTTSQVVTYGSTTWTTSVIGTTPDWVTVRARHPVPGPLLHPRRTAVGGARHGARRHHGRRAGQWPERGGIDGHRQRHIVHDHRRPGLDRVLGHH